MAGLAATSSGTFGREALRAVGPNAAARARRFRVPVVTSDGLPPARRDVVDGTLPSPPGVAKLINGLVIQLAFRAKGQTLRWLPGVMVKWYAWAAEYPKTSIEKADGDAK